MSTVLDLQMNVMLIVYLVLLAVKGFAFVNSLLWSGEHYTAAGKLTREFERDTTQEQWGL